MKHPLPYSLRCEARAPCSFETPLTVCAQRMDGEQIALAGAKTVAEDDVLEGFVTEVRSHFS